MLQFCNKHQSTVWVAVIYYSPHCPDGGDWAKKGWWQIEPGQCKIAIGGDLRNRWYYFFAEASDGSFWAGGLTTQAPQRVFDWCLNTGSTDSRVLGFRTIDTGSSKSHTVNLTG